MAGCGFDDDNNITEMVEKYLVHAGKGRETVHIRLPDGASDSAKPPEDLVKTQPDIAQHFLQIDWLKQPVSYLGHDFNAVVYDDVSKDVVATIVFGSPKKMEIPEITARWLALYNLKLKKVN
jgi:hypothetical protein